MYVSVVNGRSLLGKCLTSRGHTCLFYPLCTEIQAESMQQGGENYQVTCGNITDVKQQVSMCCFIFSQHSYIL